MNMSDTRLDFLIRLALHEEINPAIDPNDAATIYDNINRAIDFSRTGNLPLVMRSLMSLRTFVINNVRPESLTPEFADFITDANMWKWIDQASTKSRFTQYDDNAYKLVMADLNNMLSNNKVVGNIAEERKAS